MPKPLKGENKLQYPPGVRDITEDISTDDLVRRLKDCAQAFQSMSQDDDNSHYVPLALHLATEFFLEHSSKDVRLLVACCIADVFRVYAPDAPYKDPEQLKIVFEFFIQQLKGLEDPKDPIFKRYFYLLENLAWVKSFNICIELEENQKIFCSLFSLIFCIVNDNHSTKVKNFMLDMMCPLISEADMVSQELLDIVLLEIIEPKKSQNKNACTLAQDILKRTSGAIEPYIQNFFNNALILGKTSQSEVAHRLYDLIYELNTICPSMLVAVLPQLEFKLKSSEEKERLEVTKALARMFSDKSSVLAEQNKQLWMCFLGRFNDISVHVRMRCVQYSMHFLLNHHELRDDISEQLKQRNHDPEESVRYEVAMAIISAAKKDFTSVNDELLNFVKERALDKKFKIRKEALLGLASLYKQQISNSNVSDPSLKYLSWIKNKVLHVYYRQSLEDRLLVERILYTCLVPYQNPLEDRMKKLYQLYASVDDHAVKAFNELLKCQHIVRTQVKSLLDCLHREKSNDTTKLLSCKIAQLSRNLPDSVKSQEFILKFCKQLDSNTRVKSLMTRLLSENVSCSEAAHNVKEVLKTLGYPVQTNTYYMIIKQLLERVAPVMVDKDGVKHLIHCVKDSLLLNGAIDADLGLNNSAYRGLQLLHTLSFVFPVAFHDEEIMTDLLQFLQAEDEQAADSTLQIFRNICHGVEKNYPEFAMKFLPLLESFVEFGTVKQAKHAVYCLNVAVSRKEAVFGSIIDDLKRHFTLDSQYFQTALVAIGHIAFLCPDLYGNQLKSIVSKVVVKDLLMLDQGIIGCSIPEIKDLPRGGNDSWRPLDTLPDETKVKIEGMKLMVRWLMGLKDAVQPAMSTLRLLSTVILHRGDLMERQHASPTENSWLRFTAATCMLKLCQEKNYVESITLEQFQVLALMMNDECHEVRERFAQKLNKGLSFLRLPVEFLGIFSLAGVEEHKELRIQAKQYLDNNIKKRREYLKQNPLTNMKLLTMLPDYVLPYAIHLLAHAPFFKDYDDVPSLTKIKDCLWILMEPLMLKNENYSFSFFKRLIENIKQTKDKQAPNDEISNLKLYAVCDLALGIVLSKTTNFVLKDFPVEPRLPSKLFTSPDKNFSNLKTYLPLQMISTPPKKSGFEIEMFAVSSKNANSMLTAAAKKTPSNNILETALDISVEANGAENSRTNHLSHFNKSVEMKPEVITSKPNAVINDTDGTENEAPQSDDAIVPILQKSRAKSHKMSHAVKENNGLNNKSHDTCDIDSSDISAKRGNVNRLRNERKKRKIKDDSDVSMGETIPSMQDENSSQSSYANDSQLSNQPADSCDDSEQLLSVESTKDTIDDFKDSGKKLRSSRTITLRSSPTKSNQNSGRSSSVMPLKTKRRSASSISKTRCASLSSTSKATSLICRTSRTRSRSPMLISKCKSFSPSSKLNCNSSGKQLIPVITDLKYYIGNDSVHSSCNSQGSISENTEGDEGISSSNALESSESVISKSSKSKVLRATKQLKITNLYHTRNRKSTDVIKNDVSGNFSLKDNLSVLLHRDIEIESLSSQATSEIISPSKRVSESIGNLRRHSIRRVTSNNMSSKLCNLVKSPTKTEDRMNVTHIKNAAKVTKGTSHISKKVHKKDGLSPNKNHETKASTRSQASRHAKSPEKTHILRKTIKPESLANGSDGPNDQHSGTQTPSKQKHTASTLLANAIKTSSLKRSPRAKVASRRSR